MQALKLRPLAYHAHTSARQERVSLEIRPFDYHFLTHKLPTHIQFDMEPLQLRDEAVRDRIRLAEEFLDPSTCRANIHFAN